MTGAAVLAGRRAEPPPARTLVVWCPDWPVTAAGCVPVGHLAVVAADRVVAVSPAARAEGVRPGQRRREAQACCPGLSVLTRDPGGEVRAFEPVLRTLEALGVPVAVRDPGWAALGTRGPARRHGGEAGLRDAVDAALAACLPKGAWRVGVADGPFAATLAARASVDAAVVARGANAAFLEPLPVALLGRPELADLLCRLGIATLGDFARLSEADVLARFGPDGAQAQRLARGLDDHLLAGRRVPPELAVGTELDPPAERVDEAAFAARTLAVLLCDRLSGGGLACSRLAVEVRLSGGAELRRVWDHDGAWSPALVAERLRWQLEAWLTGVSTSGKGERSTEPGGGVESLRLVPLEVVPDRGRQPGLWTGPTDADERVLRVVARLQGLLGAEGVLRPVLAGGRSPGERVRLIPYGDPVPAGTLPGVAGRHGASAAGRHGASAAGRSAAGRSAAGRSAAGRSAASLPAAAAPWPGSLPSPSPAAVLGDAGEEADLLDASGERVTVDGRGGLSAPPVELLTRRGSEEVSAWAGPWPVDERWWDGPNRRRRARLQLLTVAGEGYLVHLEQGRWRVAAVYD